MTVITRAIYPQVPISEQWQIGTFDIETKPVGDESALIAPFVYGATCRDYEGDTVEFHTSLLSMLQHCLAFSDRIRWFCHNGAGFDFKYFLMDNDCIEWLKLGGYSINIVGDRIPKALIFKRGKRNIYFVDSFKLMQASLNTLSRGFNVEVTKDFIDFDEENFDEENETHKDYLKRDVVSLFQVVTSYRKIINEQFNTEPKLTASSTAFRAFATILQRPVYHHSEECNAFARQSYYGGRTECFFQGEARDVTCIDVNSLYAYIMYEFGAIECPYKTKTYQEGKPGFYRVKARVPISLKFGPLPYRKPDLSGTIFPVGVFDTFASSVEIEIARTMGCDVEIVEGFAYDLHTKELFRPFIDRCKAVRALDYNGAHGQCAKYLQNNLYGFFGMNPNRSEIIFSNVMPSEEGYEMVIDESGNPIEKLWERKRCIETVNCIPSFAAWITANARCHILNAALTEEKAAGTVYYMDTDSLFLSPPRTGLVSDVTEGRYGSFKREFVADKFVGVTAKTYLYQIDADRSPEYVASMSVKDLKTLRRTGKVYDIKGNLVKMKCKGLPSHTLNPDMYDTALENGQSTARYVQMNSIISALRKGNYGNDKATRSMPRMTSITTRVSHGRNAFTTPIVLNERN